METAAKHVTIPSPLPTPNTWPTQPTPAESSSVFKYNPEIAPWHRNRMVVDLTLNRLDCCPGPLRSQAPHEPPLYLTKLCHKQFKTSVLNCFTWNKISNICNHFS